MLVVDAKSPYPNVPGVDGGDETEGREGLLVVVAVLSGTLTGEMYKAITGVKAVEVRYKDGGRLAQRIDGR